MCLLAFKPAGVPALPPLDDFARAFAANPHGIGVAVADGSAVAVRKFANFADFAGWHGAAPYAAAPAAFAVMWHFRQATSGPVNLPMCHPFALSADPAVAAAEGEGRLPVAAHNGILSGSDFPPAPGESDTLTFVRTILAWGPFRSSLRSPRTLRVLGAAVGSHNRVAVLWPDRSYAIVNEGRGEWEGGVWYSGNRGRPAPRALPADPGGWWADDLRSPFFRPSAVDADGADADAPTPALDALAERAIARPGKCVP